MTSIKSTKSAGDNVKVVIPMEKGECFERNYSPETKIKQLIEDFRIEKNALLKPNQEVKELNKNIPIDPEITIGELAMMENLKFTYVIKKSKPNVQEENNRFNQNLYSGNLKETIKENAEIKEQPQRSSDMANYEIKRDSIINESTNNVSLPNVQDKDNQYYVREGFDINNVINEPNKINYQQIQSDKLIQYGFQQPQQIKTEYINYQPNIQTQQKFIYQQPQQYVNNQVQNAYYTQKITQPKQQVMQHFISQPQQHFDQMQFINQVQQQPKKMQIINQEQPLQVINQQQFIPQIINQTKQQQIQAQHFISQPPRSFYGEHHFFQQVNQVNPQVKPNATYTQQIQPGIQKQYIDNNLFSYNLNNLNNIGDISLPTFNNIEPQNIYYINQNQNIIHSNPISSPVTQINQPSIISAGSQPATTTTYFDLTPQQSFYGRPTQNVQTIFNQTFIPNQPTNTLSIFNNNNNLNNNFPLEINIPGLKRQTSAGYMLPHYGENYREQGMIRHNSYDYIL